MAVNRDCESPDNRFPKMLDRDSMNLVTDMMWYDTWKTLYDI